MNIVVVGGRGLVGRNIVERLRNEGHHVSAVSRATGVDVITGQGLAECMAGAEVVIDVTNSPTFDDEAAFHFFRTAIGNLLEAELAAGVRHHTTLSIVGTQRLEDSHYLRGKALQDRLIRASGIPFTIVHATQFYEFLVAIIESAVRDQVVRLSPAYIQPVASDDVAALMAALAVGQPLNGSIEIAGPERERMSELIQRFVVDLEAPCDVQADRRAPYFGAMLDEDSLVPGDGSLQGSVGFQRWLERSEFSRVGW
ncbi:SDR family oxidoreductase [Luteibacter sp. Lutesp34]|uniref:SDR family oxidoreductase n=1 Tax=Luteibacter sp. Lutesp34 TaxID=3243030 RepID=UPI0039B63065